MNGFRKYIAFLIVALAVAGCTSSSVPLPPPPTLLSGRVQLYDGLGNALATDTGVMVSVNGSSATANTNDSGQWLLSGIAVGSYTLTFTKPGFGTVKQFGDSVILSDTIHVPTVAMSQAPADVISLQAFEILASKTINVPCQMPTPFAATRTVVCCLSTDSASLATNPYEAPWIFANVAAGGYDGEFSVTSDTTLSEDSLAHGTIVYATVCIVGEGNRITGRSAIITIWLQSGKYILRWGAAFQDPIRDSSRDPGNYFASYSFEIFHKSYCV